MKKIKNTTKKCPTCLGKGVVPDLFHYSPEIRAEVRKLFRTGMSLRKIGEKVGINHPQKIAHILKTVV